MDYKGLTEKQADLLLQKHGQNTLGEYNKKSLFVQFFQQFNNFLIYLLLISTIIAFVIGDSTDGFLILAIVIANAFFGLYQEIKAENALSLLKDMSITPVRVIRNGKEKEIDSRNLVPGDLIYIEEGAKIPADCAVLKSIGLQINEASLTGESLQIAKNNKDEIFMGTIVVSGRGYAEVVNTGIKTKFGQIAEKLATITETKTPLQIKLESLSKTIGILGIISAIIVFAFSIVYGSSLFSSFLLAISLAVAVVPEGLPAVMTATLAIGVKKMAHERAIIRKLTSLETLGNINLLATDKTGTLTTNEMKVKEVYLNNSIKSIDELRLDDKKSVKTLMLNSVLCSTASLDISDKNNKKVLGDPTEGAFLYLAHDLDFNIEQIRKTWKIIEEKPFNPTSKLMSVLTGKDHEKYAFVKGAPESVLNIVSHFEKNDSILKISKKEKIEIIEVVENWAKQGLRVMAFAYKKNPNKELNFLEKNKEYIFHSLVALHDPPREGIRESVQHAYDAGISTVMITGDNIKTAEAIAFHAGIIKGGEKVMTGIQLQKLSDKELLKIIEKIKVFARVTPLDKYRIVSLFQKKGYVVAVTGDGVNDAIALKQADVGVAMGKIATDVARETSDMVITDDDYKTIVQAIEEGRHIIRNLKNAVKYLLTSNLIEATVIIGGFIVGVSNILLPIQILYINLISDGFPALALAFSPTDEEVMKRPPQKKSTLLNKSDITYIFSIGITISVLILITYFFLVFKIGDSLAKTSVFFMVALVQTYIFVDLWLSHRPIFKNINLLISLIFVVAFSIPFITQLLIGQVPLLNEIFKIDYVSWSFYLFFVIVSGLISFSIHFVKKFIKQ